MFNMNYILLNIETINYYDMKEHTKKIAFQLSFLTDQFFKICDECTCTKHNLASLLYPSSLEQCKAICIKDPLCLVIEHWSGNDAWKHVPRTTRCSICIELRDVNPIRPYHIQRTPDGKPINSLFPPAVYRRGRNIKLSYS